MDAHSLLPTKIDETNCAEWQLVVLLHFCSDFFDTCDRCTPGDTAEVTPEAMECACRPRRTLHALCLWMRSMPWAALVELV